MSETEYDDLSENGENQNAVATQGNRKFPVIDFAASHRRARFNWDRICRKYENMAESGIEVDVKNDIVYAPADMPLPTYKKKLDKFTNFSLKFGASSAGAAIGNCLQSYDNDKDMYHRSLALNKQFRGIRRPSMVNKWRNKKLSQKFYRVKEEVIKSVETIKSEYASQSYVNGDFREGQLDQLSYCKEEERSRRNGVELHNDITENEIGNEGYCSTSCSAKSGCIEPEPRRLQLSSSNSHGELLPIKYEEDLDDELSVRNDTVYDDAGKQEYCFTNCSIRSGCIESNKPKRSSAIDMKPISEETLSNNCKEEVDDDLLVGNDIDDYEVGNQINFPTNCSVLSGCIEPGRKKAKLVTSCQSTTSDCQDEAYSSPNRSGLVCNNKSDDVFESSDLFKPDSSDFWNQPLYVLLDSYPPTAKEVFGCNRQMCTIFAEDVKRTLLQQWTQSAFEYILLKAVETQRWFWIDDLFLTGYVRASANVSIVDWSNEYDTFYENSDNPRQFKEGYATFGYPKDSSSTDELFHIVNDLV